MKLFKTGINPNNYKQEVGELEDIYTTTISYPATMLLIFSILVFLFGFGINFYLRSTILIVPVYILLNPRFTYISIHKKGIIFKKRFTHRIIKFDEMEDIELRNMSILWNQFRRKDSKIYGLDIYLKNNKRYSYGERERIFKSLRYPRLDSFTSIYNVQEVYERIHSLIKISGITTKQKLILYLISSIEGYNGIYKLVQIFDRAHFPSNLSNDLNILIGRKLIKIGKAFDNGTASTYAITNKGIVYISDLNIDELIEYIQTMDNPELLLEIIKGRKIKNDSTHHSSY